jgi:hypothetical protein
LTVLDHDRYSHDEYVFISYSSRNWRCLQTMASSILGYIDIPIERLHDQIGHVLHGTSPLRTSAKGAKAKGTLTWSAGMAPFCPDRPLALTDAEKQASSVFHVI